MKVAGRKNDGAWFRTNKEIKKLRQLDNEFEAALSQEIQDIESYPAMLAAMKDMATQAGIDVNSDTVFVDSFGLANVWAGNGFPRQVYNGELSFDTYLPPGQGGNDKDYWVKEHAAPFRQFGKDLRNMLVRFLKLRRQIIDLQNLKTRVQGNPGGIADATKST